MKHKTTSEELLTLRDSILNLQEVVWQDIKQHPISNLIYFSGVVLIVEMNFSLLVVVPLVILSLVIHKYENK